jgi:hypothetical protein
VKSTSSAVKGAPSCQRTPFRRWKVMTSPSFETSQDSARSPTTFMSLSYLTRPLKTRPEISWEALSEARIGMRLLASPMEPSTRMSP